MAIYDSNNETDSITRSFIRYRTCYVILGFKESECFNLEANSSSLTFSVLDRKVQPSAILISSTLSIIQSLIPPLLCFFIGPWCNQYGRKPIMLYSTFALMVQYTTMIFISSVPNMSPWYILLSQILLCISGGIPAFVAVIFSYLTDIISEQDRGIRMAILEAVRSFGILIGMVTGIATLKSSSYITVYSLSVITLVLAWGFIWIYVPESIQVTQVENKLNNFFDFGSLVSTAKTVFKSRENYNRAVLLSLIGMIILYIISTTGSNNVSSMYFQHQFYWKPSSSINYYIVVTITTIIGGLICVYVLHIKLNCAELTGIVAGLISFLSGAFVLAVATSTSIIHLGSCMQCFGPAILSMAKSLISKLIPHEEVSTIFAVIASLETVFALVGVSLFAVIYNSTVSNNPATYLYVNIGVAFCQLCLVSILVFIQRYWTPLSFSPIENEGY